MKKDEVRKIRWDGAHIIQGDGAPMVQEDALPEILDDLVVSECSANKNEEA